MPGEMEAFAYLVTIFKFPNNVVFLFLPCKMLCSGGQESCCWYHYHCLASVLLHCLYSIEEEDDEGKTPILLAASLNLHEELSVLFTTCIGEKVVQ